MAKLYTDLKVIHFGSKLKDISKGTLSAPIHIRLKPTNKCNHKCYYCCYRNENLYLSELINPNEEIPWKKMKEIIRDLKQMRVKAVTFSGGGEPLYYPYIIKTMKSLLDEGIKIALLTNGSLLKGEIAKVLGQRATWIRISMDAADSNTYAKIRGINSEEFDNVCENISNFAKIKNRKAQLGINFIITKENCNSVYKFLKLMKGLGVDHVKISESIVSTKREDNKKYHFSSLNLVKKQIIRGLSNLVDNNFKIIDKFDNFIEDSNYYKKKYTWCPFIQCLTVIGADMNVYTCYDKAYTKSGKLGSIKDKSFRELWFSNKTKEKMLHLNPSKDCMHHCTQHTKNLVLLDYLDVDKEHMEFV